MVAKIISNDKLEIKVIPDDKPSSPSIKLIAFVIPTIHPTVNMKLRIGEITESFIVSIFIPNPYTITAATTCTINFCQGLRFLMSSI